MTAHIERVIAVSQGVQRGITLEPRDNNKDNIVDGNRYGNLRLLINNYIDVYVKLNI